MSSINTLTSLARARSWAGVTSTSDDDTLTALIREVSRFILNYLGRPSMFETAYSQLMDGAGEHSVMLRHWPVTQVTSVTINDMPISASDNTMLTGYVCERWDGQSAGMPQRLGLRGYSFSHGLNNVCISYNAGYKIIAEPQLIPSTGLSQVTVNAPYGNWGSDGSVTYADGTALTLVTATPMHGQYTASAGVYGFASADAGLTVLISYSYIPADIEHACVALVAERYRYRTHIGEVSKSLSGNETMTYSQKDMPEFVRSLLQPYKRVLAV